MTVQDTGTHKPGDKTFHVELVTPEQMKFSDDVRILSLPGVEGQMAILPNHAPILALLDPGHLMLRTRGEEIHMAVGGGFVKMSANRAVCLVDFAERREEIDAAAVEKDISEVTRELAGKASAEKREALRRRLKALRARLEVARRKDSG